MKQPSIKKNIVMNAILTMSSFIFPLITFPYVSRILLPVGTGKVSFATSLISYFTIFSQLGIPTYGIRACAKVRDDRDSLSKTAQELLIINLITCLISYFALFIALKNVARLQEDRTLYIVVSFTIVLSAIGMEWLYKGLEQYTYITIRSVTFKFVALIAMFVLIHKQSDYVIYGAISIFAASASNILNFINVHKFIDIRPVGAYDFKRHLRPICVFFAMAFATTIYTNLDTLMLGFMTNDIQVGYYNAAVKIKTILVSLVTSLSAVLLPRASYYVEHGQIQEFKNITKKAINFVLLVATPLLVYAILYAKECILFLSGDAYTPSIIPMQIIMPTVLLIGLTNIIGIQVLVPLGLERIVLHSVLLGAGTDLILNAILIPKYTAVGAAIGTLFAECIVLVVQFMALKENLSDAIKGISISNRILGVIISAVACSTIKLLNLTPFVALVLSAIVFAVLYSAYLLISKDLLFIEIFEQVKRKIWK